MHYSDFERAILALCHFPRLTPLEILILYLLYTRGPLPILTLYSILPNFADVTIRKRISIMRAQGTIKTQRIKLPKYSRQPLTCCILTETGSSLILDIFSSLNILSENDNTPHSP